MQFWSKFKLAFILNKWRLFCTIILLITTSFVIGYYLGHSTTTSQEYSSQEEQHEKGYQLISPLLNCSNASSHSLVLSDLKNRAQNIINLSLKNKQISHLSLYFRDLNNGPWFGINETKTFSPASLMKVPLLISYLKNAESNPKILDKKIFVTMQRSEALSQNIIPANQITTGQEYSVNEFLEHMIKYSDNLAANTLLMNADSLILNKIYDDMNIIFPTNGNTENFMTVIDYASFFRILYNASYLNRDMSEMALNILSQTEFKNGLVGGIPANIIVAHKFGERVLMDSKQIHDCGIIYKPNKPYLLCIMTRGDNLTQMTEVIKNISQSIFNNY